MKFERTQHLCAGHHERTQERNGYANGFKHRTLKTKLGTIELSVRQLRGRDEAFQSASLDAAMASEKPLRVARAEKYIKGGAPRRVKSVHESFCGFLVSATVSVSYPAECTWNCCSGCDEGGRYTGQVRHAECTRHALCSRSAKAKWVEG